MYKRFPNKDFTVRKLAILQSKCYFIWEFPFGKVQGLSMQHKKLTKNEKLLYVRESTEMESLSHNFFPLRFLSSYSDFEVSPRSMSLIRLRSVAFALALTCIFSREAFAGSYSIQKTGFSDGKFKSKCL